MNQLRKKSMDQEIEVIQEKAEVQDEILVAALKLFAEKGYFFIHSSTAIKLLYLQDYYEKIINAKTIESIINLSNDKIKDIYNSTTTAIQQTIIDIIIKGIQDNSEACRDRNKIEFISTLSGKDLEKIAKELKEFEDK